MAVKIRLKRMGKKRQPSYRVVVADGRSPRDGRFIEQIGRYDPLTEPSVVEIDNDRALDWLSKGAQPTAAARKLLEISGAWSQFRATKGEVFTMGAAVPEVKVKMSKKQKAVALAAAEAATAPAEEAAAPEETAPEVAEDAAAPEAAAETPTEEAPAEEAAAPEEVTEAAAPQLEAEAEAETAEADPDEAAADETEGEAS